MITKNVFLSALLLVFVISSASVLGAGEVAGSCPDGFALHPAGPCGCDHQSGSHMHAGTSVDRNGDGFICMKHVSSGGRVHVHIDNNKQGKTPASQYLRP